MTAAWIVSLLLFGSFRCSATTKIETAIVYGCYFGYFAFLSYLTYLSIKN